MEALGLDNIFGEEEMDGLFGGQDDFEKDGSDGSPESKDTSDNPEKNVETVIKTTEVVKPENLFEDVEDEQPESVGSEETEKEQGDTSTDDGGTSPQNFYSSIANAMAVDGIFPNLDEEAINKVVDAETLSEAIEAEINARLDEKQQRISKALENGVEVNSIRQYENTLSYLNSITESQLADESEKGEELRQRIIYQDFLNKNYKPEKAQKLTQRTIEAGTDIEDAKEALQSNKEFFQESYNKILHEAQKEADAAKAERQQQEIKLKKSILEDKDLLGDMELSPEVRKKVFDSISKPVYKDPESGQYMTALQKYEQEHHEDFLKYVGLFMTLTNGFKDFKSFAKAEVKKEMRKGLRELEHTLSNTKRDASGKLELVGKKDTESSFIGDNFRLAL